MMTSNVTLLEGHALGQLCEPIQNNVDIGLAGRQCPGGHDADDATAVGHGVNVPSIDARRPLREIVDGGDVGA